MHKPFITIYECMIGWKAQILYWNDEIPEIGGFWEPWQTSYFAYPTPEEAEQNALDWAKAEDLEYKRPSYVQM
jgi:hypothetical protein